MLDQQLFIRRLLDRPRDALPVLRPENQRAQNQQVQGALAAIPAVPFLVG